MEENEKAGGYGLFHPGKLLAITCALFGVYCGGATSTDQRSNGAAGAAASAGFGYAGHTASCAPSGCRPGGEGGTSGAGAQGGISGAGAGGISGASAQGGISGAGAGGISGASAQGGISGSSFAGHTGACLLNQCMPGCPNWPGCECYDGCGGGGAQGGAGGEAGAVPFIAPVTTRACYSISAFEAPPCAPADDTVLAWLSGLPSQCSAHVATGPFARVAGEMQSCCYDVSCD